MSALEKCHDCGRCFVEVANHWASSNCQPPTPTEFQQELIESAILTDTAQIRTAGHRRNAFLIIETPREQSADWLHTALDDFITTAETITKHDKPHYQLRTHCLQHFTDMRAAWYPDGGVTEVVPPEPLSLTGVGLQTMYTLIGTDITVGESEVPAIPTDRLDAPVSAIQAAIERYTTIEYTPPMDPGRTYLTLSFGLPDTDTSAKTESTSPNQTLTSD